MSGIDEDVADNIVDYRKQYGPFINLLQLRGVPGLDEQVFEQCAGFLKIYSER